MVWIYAIWRLQTHFLSLIFYTPPELWQNSQIWGSSAIYLLWRRDHATWWCGERWYFSWNRCLTTPRKVRWMPPKKEVWWIVSTHNHGAIDPIVEFACSSFMFLKAYRFFLDNFILGSLGRFKISMDEMLKIEPNKKPWVQFFSDFSHFGHLPVCKQSSFGYGLATSRAQHHSWQHLRFCISPGTGQGNIAGTWHCGWMWFLNIFENIQGCGVGGY